MVVKINWPGAKLLGAGANGVVFELSPTKVIKIGYNLSWEVEHQRTAVREGLGVPVIEYITPLELPDYIRTIVETEVPKLTDRELSGIVMWKVKELRDDEEQTLQMIFALDGLFPGFQWDSGNPIAMFRGKKVALDFGLRDNCAL